MAAFTGIPYYCLKCATTGPLRRARDFTFGRITGIQRPMPATGEKHTPWYVRVMLGVAGLIAAVFLLGFIGVGVAFVIKSQTASIAVGLMVITASYAIFRLAPRNDFSTMFALAVSLAGQALVIFGLFGVFASGHEKSFPWGTVALFEAALALVIPNFTHRAISAFGAGAAFGFACGA